MIMGRPPIDLTGKKFGKLTALKIIERGGSHKPVKWLCICDCGGEKIVDSQLLRRGLVTSCGCSVKNRFVGKRFGRLVVLSHTNYGRNTSCGNIIWKCRCDCGNITYVSTNNLISKYSKTLSCGCLRRENSTKHNLSETKIYKTLVAIKGRCKNKNNKNYFRYGGRGITICQEWDGEHGFENFYKWSMENGYADGLTIDRIDNDKGYSPDNCRWVTPKTQMNNTRRNVYIEINGIKKSLTEWAEIYGISIGTVRDRIRRGWSKYDAITKEVRKHAAHPSV
mgnify:CR=1 FL=1